MVGLLWAVWRRARLGGFVMKWRWWPSRWVGGGVVGSVLKRFPFPKKHRVPKLMLWTCLLLRISQVRKVNDKLFVGLGYIQAFGGKYNSAPFILEGPPVHPFSAPDGTK